MHLQCANISLFLCLLPLLLPLLRRLSCCWRRRSLQLCLPSVLGSCRRKGERTVVH